MKIADWETTDEGLHLIIKYRRWHYIPLFSKTTRVRYHPYHVYLLQGKRAVREILHP